MDEAGNERASRPARPLPERFVVGVLMLVMFISGADLLVMTPVLPTMAEELGVGPDIGGLWVTGYAVATGVFALAFGPISDRFGRRTVLRAGMVVLMVGTAACGFAFDFFSLLAARCLAGAGAGILVTSTTSYAGDHFATERRAVVMGWVMNGFFLALILAVPLGAFLAGQFGWQNMFFVIAAAAALVAAAIFLLPEPRFEQRSRSLSFPEAILSYRSLLQNRRVVGVLLMSFSIGLSMTMFSVYSSPWLLETFGLDVVDRGLVYAVGGPAVVLGSPLAGRLSNHFGRISLVMAGSVLMGLMQLAMPVTEHLNLQIAASFDFRAFFEFGHHPWPVVLPSLVVFFLAMAAGASRSGPFQTLALEVSPPHQRGAVSALRNASNQLGSGLGAATGGFLWSQLDPAYPAICGLAAAITFGGAVLLRGLVGSDRPSSVATVA